VTCCERRPAGAYLHPIGTDLRYCYLLSEVT
jgi:hypothetical protein